MEQGRWGWWGRHGLTVALLCTAAGLAFFVRSLWMFQLIQQYGASYLFGGGSDSFYHFRVSYYIVQNHTNLIVDPLLKYPFGAINPREPLFDWMNAVLAIVFAGFFGGNTVASTSFFLEMGGPIWAALGVFPVFLIGREISDRRVGVIAGFLYALSVANINSSTLGYSNYLSFYMFFILLTVFGYLKTIHYAGTRRWVPSYRNPRQYPQAVREFVRTERQAVKWAVFTGVCFGALALAWQGYSLVVAAMIIFLILAMIIERIRRVDSFGLYVSTWIIGIIGFPMAAPYFWVQGLIIGWFGLPLLVFAGGLLLCLPLLVLRDQPWVVSIPAFLLVALAGIGSLYFIDKATFLNIVTGQGYFVKTLIYSTVAEAQAPSIDQLILGYGVITFFLAFVGLALLVYRLIRGRFPRVLLMAVVFAGISIYLPISAAKFFLLGSAIFALLPAEALIRALDVAEFPKLRRTVAQLSDRRSQAAAFRRAFKARHALVLILVVGLLLPNVWYAVDGGIAYNYKGTYSQQIYNSLPGFLQTSPANASSFYLGAAGTELDTPPQYDEAGYNWLATQDQNLTPGDRPAFVSWWDYGFQAVAEGQHPSVADNFQNGIDPSGNFLLSQNESLAIGVLTTTLLSAESKSSGDSNLPPALNTILANDNVDLTVLHNLLNNPSYDIALVLSHPDRYLAVDPSHLDGENAMYDTVSWYLASTRSTNDMAQVYDDVQQYTHWSIRYAMVDNRLFPFSGSDTGIFYAPADLTDRVISSGGAPTTYYTVNITGSDGNTYPYGPLPAGVTAAAYPITYHPAFYNSMLYHIFIGYNSTEAGLGTTPSSQIPGVTLSNALPEPGWMMSHFQLVYQTAYYCPYTNPSGHPGCEVAMNLPEAQKLSKATNGSVDASESTYANSGGEMILEYYPGEPVTGSVRLPNGDPVSGVRVTVSDSFGIPHMATTTGPDGQYSLILPPGNDTLNVTTGRVDLVNQQGTTLLLSIPIDVPAAYGLSLDATPMVRPITLAASTVEGTVYWNTAKNDTYQPHIDPLAVGATAVLWGQGTPRSALTDASGTYRFDNVAPGTYNLTVLYRGTNYTNATTATVYAQPGQTENHSVSLSPATLTGHVFLSDGTPSQNATVLVSDGGGVVANATVETNGNYTIPNVPSGNLSVRSYVPGENLASAQIALVNVVGGGNLVQNLTVEAYGHVSLTVLSNGYPVAGFPVRFVPIVPFSTYTSTTSPGGNQTGPNSTSANQSAANGGPIHANATLLITGASGTLNGNLPIGNYSVYGLGLVGSTWSAGFARAEVTAQPTGLAALSVSPAGRISGTIVPPGGAGARTVQILAYDATGGVAWTFTNNTGDWGLSLPYGTYSLLAVEPAGGQQINGFTQVARVTVSSAPTDVPLSLIPAVLFRPVVGMQPVTAGPVTGVAGARVQVSIPKENLLFTAVTNASGNISFYLPLTLPDGVTYCVNATAPGYAPYSRCDLASGSLGIVTQVGMVANTSALQLVLTGLPASGGATVNVTLQGASESTSTLHGQGTISTTVSPGQYKITGWAPAPSGTPGLYQIQPTVNLHVPVGGAPLQQTLAFTHLVRANASLRLPPGMPAANATIDLFAPGVNATVAGGSFDAHFWVAPGTYTVLANAQGRGGPYSTLTALSFNATGVANHPLVLSGQGTTLTLNLSVPGATLGNGTLYGRLTASNGLSFPITFTNGRYVGAVPTNLSYTAQVSGTALLASDSGTSYYANLTTASSPVPCPAINAATSCPVLLTAEAEVSGISGSLTVPGFPGVVPGTVVIIGSGASPTPLVINAPSGTFSAALSPGLYTLYAHTPGTTGLFANLTEITVGPSPTTGLSVLLTPAWTDAVTLVAPAGATFTTGHVVFTTPSQLTLTLSNLTVGTATNVVLPIGTYSVYGFGTGSPYGVPVNATSSTSLTIYQGNSASNLDLAWQFHQIVLFHVPVAYVTLGDGGNVTLPFSLQNVGNQPFQVTFIGSPATFNFTFSPANASLGLSPSNDSMHGSVLIRIPSGTLVAHPPIQLEAKVVGANGAVAGFASPAPVVNLTATYGLVTGQGAVSGASAAPFNISIPYYVRNTGTVPESVNLTVLDGARLAGLGWTVHILQGVNRLHGPPSVPAGGNSSFDVVLNATAGHALPPGSVSIVAQVLNGTGGLRLTSVLSVPTTQVQFGSNGLVVVGPQVGSPPSTPDWVYESLAFVPMLGFLVVAVTYRWYRTRRWTRR